MGNSEVGHLTIGSGRILFQDLQRVNVAIRDGSLFENQALVAAFERARARGGDVHLLGLVSKGGVHSHLEHLQALLELARRRGMEERTWIHAFTDGRDVSPTSAVSDLAELPAERIATVVGRYYAMDRDKRWERTERALDAIARGTGSHVPVQSLSSRVQESYEAGITDEFLEPIVVDGTPRLGADDAAILFNFRPDRGRQLAQRLVEAGVDLTTMTRYSKELDLPVAFGEQLVVNTLAEVLAGAGARQLHTAETEKYAHVTYFFNGGVEREWPGETRILVPSPRDVPSYDHKPEMSAREVAARFAAEIGAGYRFAVINFANPDMVGHTGSIPAVTEAVEVTDECLAVVVEATHSAGGVCLVTADHGNAEQMLEADGVSPHTAHTTNPVPLVLTSSEAGLKEGGELSDLAPTTLRLLGLDTPSEMTGDNLCATSEAESSFS
jgi:2,3-bisphosphoglycerate-independent phosphoglycerate mutase